MIDCSIDGCGGRARTRGWCGKHYARWLRRGDPLALAVRDHAARFRTHYQVRENGCWEWTGAVLASGYGLFSVSGKHVVAHRFGLSLAKDVPDGMPVDHLCRNRKCVNPDHLESVTTAENARRAGQYELYGKCKWGHPITPENIHLSPRGDRTCLTCYRARNQRPRRPLREVFAK